MKHGSPRRTRSLLKNLGLSVVSLLVFLILAEALVSVLESGEKVHRPGVRDAITGFRLRPDNSYTEVGGAEVRTNSRGFRDNEVPSKRPSGGIRILAVGDSSTFGYGVLREETYVERLERGLQARFPDKPVEVINAGTPGWSSASGAAFLAGEGLSWNPDLVIVSLGYNEQLGSGPGAPHYDYDPQQRRVLFHPLGVTVRDLIRPAPEIEGREEVFSDRFNAFPRRLKLYALTERMLHASRQGLARMIGHLKSSGIASRVLRGAYQRDPERIYAPLRVAVKGNHVMESYAANLEAIASICRDAGVPVVFLLQPRRAFREFVDFLPEVDRAANLEGLALLRAGNPQKAVAILAPRNAARPQDAVTAYHLGIAYHLEGKNAEARAHLEQIVSIRSFTLNAIVLMTAGRLGVPVIMAILPLAGSESGALFFPDRYHVTASGYAFIASEVEKFLDEEAVLDAAIAQGE